MIILVSFITLSHINLFLAAIVPIRYFVPVCTDIGIRLPGVFPTLGSQFTLIFALNGHCKLRAKGLYQYPTFGTPIVCDSLSRNDTEVNEYIL